MKNFFFKIILLSIICLPVLSAAAQSAADKILGTYYIADDQSDEAIKIKITKASNNTYEGCIIWMKYPNFKDGTPKTDIKNPDPAKRKTPADKIQMLYHFTYDAKENKWVNGEIYDPVHGKTYKSKMWFESATELRVRGYVGVPALGRTMKWKRL